MKNINESEGTAHSEHATRDREYLLERNEPEGTAHSERGAIMVMVMIITAMIAAMAIAYVATTTSQGKVVDASIDNLRFERAALSGFDMTRAYLLSTYTPSTTGWDTELTNSFVNSGTYYTHAYIGYTLPDTDKCSVCANYCYVVSPSITAGVNKSLFQWARNIDYYDNTYFAQIENNNDGGGATDDVDGVLKLTVEGWGNGNDPNDRSQQILLEAMITYRKEPYIPDGAVVVGGSVNIFGNVDIGGTNGSIEANGAVTVSGSANVAGDVTAVGTITAGVGNIDGTPNPGSDETQIPPISPPDYKYLADHIFKSNGLVYDQSDVEVATPAGWSYSGGEWSKTANDINNGVYYFEDSDVSIGGSAGDPSNPMTLTILSTGYIKVTGSPSLMPHPSGGGIALMAGTDLKMNGAGGNVYGVGLYAAHEQVSFKGTPVVNGCVLAEDYEDVCSLVSSPDDFVEFGGNVTITYNGDLVTALTDGYPYIKVLGFKKRIKARY